MTSLDYDREVKARIYAESGVPEYWLVDLADRSVLCYAEPRSGTYQKVHQRRSGESLAPTALPQCSIPVDVLLVD